MDTVSTAYRHLLDGIHIGPGRRQFRIGADGNLIEFETDPLFVSPFLMRPLRELADAQRDRAELEDLRWQSRQAQQHR
jgi:hypothetical protein